MLSIIFNIFILFLLTCCSGYRVRDNGNPFARFGIHSVAIPMFVNHSGLPNVSSPLTKEITLMLSRFTKLKIYPGEYEDADAVLVGMITSNQYLRSVVTTNTHTYITGNLKKSIGPRNEFYVPRTSNISLNLRLVLIKGPSKNDRKLIESNLQHLINANPKKILNESINLKGHFSRTVHDNISNDSGGVVNFTKTKKIMESTIESMAKSAASTFKHVVLNVF